MCCTTKKANIRNKTLTTVLYLLIYKLELCDMDKGDFVLNFKRTIDVRANFARALSLLGFPKRFIAERSGMPPGSLGGVLTNNNPTIHQLYKLSCGLGVSIKYLIEGGDPEEELRENYGFSPFSVPVLNDDWQPLKPNVAARVGITLRETKQTKAKAAKKINVIPSWWAPILKRNNPTAVVLERMAYALDVAPAVLVEPVPLDEYGRVMIPKVHY